VVGLPLPFLAIELARLPCLQQKFVMDGGTSCTECFLSALARLAIRRNDQTIIQDTQLHLVTQPALLDEVLRNPDAAGVADLKQLCLHAVPICNYIVITLHFQGRTLWRVQAGIA
jgi:hypothetical protein